MAFGDILDTALSVSATTDSTSFALTLPFAGSPASRAGKVLYAIVTGDGAPSLTIGTGTGWVRLDQTIESSSAVSAVLLWKAAATGTSADNLTILSSTAQQFSGILLCIDGGAAPALAFGVAQGSSTDSDPPNLSFGGTFNALVIASRSGEDTIVATAAPSGYGNFQTRAGGGSSGVSTNTATKLVTAGASENPGPFTSAFEQWVCYTTAILDGGQMLSSPVLANVSTLYTPTVTPGAASAAPPVLTNSSVLYGSSVSPGAQTLNALLLTNASSLYAATAAPGAVRLSPGPLTNTSGFHGATVTRGAVPAGPGILTNASTLYAPTLTLTSDHPALLPGRLDNLSAVFAPIIPGAAQTLLPGLLLNLPAALGPAVKNANPPGTYRLTIEGRPRTVRVALTGGGAVAASSIPSTGRVIAFALKGRP